MMSLTFGLFTQVSGSGPLGPLVYPFTLINVSVSVFQTLPWIGQITPSGGQRKTGGSQDLVQR